MITHFYTSKNTVQKTNRMILIDNGVWSFPQSSHLLQTIRRFNFSLLLLAFEVYINKNNMVILWFPTTFQRFILTKRFKTPYSKGLSDVRHLHESVSNRSIKPLLDYRLP